MSRAPALNPSNSPPGYDLLSSHEHFPAHCIWCGGCQRGSHDLRRALSEQACGTITVPDLRRRMRRRCRRTVRTAVRYSRRLYRCRSLCCRPRFAVRAARSLGVDRAARTFGRRDARQHCWRVRHDEFRRILLLLPHHNVLVSGTALGSLGDGVGESSRRPRTASADTQMTIDFSNSTTGAVGDRTRIDSDYVFHELTRSICPNCRASVVRNPGRSCRSCTPMPKLTSRIPTTTSRARFRWRTAPPSSTAACVYRKPYPS